MNAAAVTRRLVQWARAASPTAVALLIVAVALIVLAATGRYQTTRLGTYEVVRTDRLTGATYVCLVRRPQSSACARLRFSAATAERRNSSLSDATESRQVAPPPPRMDTTNSRPLDDPVAELDSLARRYGVDSTGHPFHR